MYYSGENRYFRFTEGCCEAASAHEVTVSAAASLGNRLAAGFSRFSVGCDGFSHIHHLYALCSGISAAGRDVYVYENTNLPSFRFGFPLLSSDCGLFISGSSTLRISVFGGDRLPVSADVIAELMEAKDVPACGKCGKIISAGSFRELYIANIRERIGEGTVLNAAISCGTRSVRTLWEELFTENDSTLSFQVSADGQCVNAFSQSSGFIPSDKLVLAYAAVKNDTDGIPVPEDFHFQADEAGLRIKRTARSGLSELPAEKIRHLVDPLYMCAVLTSDRQRFEEAVSSLPQLGASRREIPMKFRDTQPFRQTVILPDGVIRLTRSGLNRLSLIAQARSAETASELCSEWCGRLGRLSDEGFDKDITI